MHKPQNLLGFGRVLLGVFVFVELSRSGSSWYVLPAVVLAAATDWLDGRLARSRSEQSEAGRLTDNVADAVFLAFSFSGFALTATWTHPPLGSAIRYSPYANWLPLAALAASFGSYLLRWSRSTRSSHPIPFRSVRGHSAGVANYALAIIGGVAVLPAVYVTRWFLEPAFVTVALLNLTATADNLAAVAGLRRGRV